MQNIIKIFKGGRVTDLKLEVFSWAIADAINSAIKYVHIDTDAIHSVAFTVLNEIKVILADENIEDDFDVVEEILCVFEKYNISAGGRHDFG